MKNLLETWGSGGKGSVVLVLVVALEVTTLAKLGLKLAVVPPMFPHISTAVTLIVMPLISSQGDRKEAKVEVSLIIGGRSTALDVRTM